MRLGNRFTFWMQKKLLLLFLLVLSAFIGLTVRMVMIVRADGEKYKKQVLSQQSYDSRTIPFRRGNILDAKGTKLAVSEKVYNVILDARVMLDKKEYADPTIAAVQSELGIDGAEIRSRLSSHPQSSYYVLRKQMTYEEISGFKALMEDPKAGKNIKGIWFEEEYKRKYPNGTMACDAIGFTTSDNNGLYGLEQYYNEVLSGTPGREYGYLNGDSNLERTTIPAVDGNSIVSTIDATIQGIVEKHLKKFDEQYKNNFTERNGSNSTACIIMEVNTGKILAMASYPVFDLNNPKDVTNLIGMPMVNEVGNRTGEYITEANFAAMNDELQSQQFNALWRNYCINDTYEPGSVAKPFTVAAALDTGSITGNEVYTCNGNLKVGGHEISCHNQFGDGAVSVARGVESSCNVAMMYINEAVGIDTFIDYQHIFNFGLKTNIDLWGESRTASLVYNKENMKPVDLATNSFGQGFNTTMIQMIAGFCSLINGGNYYEPHMVSKIISPSGATVENIEPRLLKQTISASTSEKIIEYCNLVVTGEKGTGKTARPAGYMIGGKTGTAETLPRGNKEYVVSFMGYAPADDPQIAIYVVVDRPNVQYQDDAKFATRIVRSILTEVLPYLGIFMTEELTEEERESLEALQMEIMAPVAPEEGAEGETQDPETAGQEQSSEIQEEEDEEGTQQTEVWRSFPVDPETGYVMDPNTGMLLDPETGDTIGSSSTTPAGLGSPGGSSGMEENADENSPF
ncbi:MAG: cell division protein FtsI [Lachnospiraceae bacterium]|nr:cell division protein FtsI [Lachnospiraceae bacterium]